ncbi:transposase family protein [Candidatus Electronema sp. JM]|uniref:transposase family protein n=1 Tax=Candidatus Electronema sp. JM TaxID=3401571 RepID=UPI003AA84D09
MSQRQKKTFSVKNNIIANSSRMIMFLTFTADGKKHDKKISNEAGYVLPKGSCLLQDAGFQWFSVKNIFLFQPMKKKPGTNLTYDQKEMNKNVSSIRIKTEHIASLIKRCRIVKDKFRNWLRGFAETVMEIACALHNFCLIFRP